MTAQTDIGRSLLLRISFLIVTLCGMLAGACSHRVELRQEINALNDYMPADMEHGLVAESVSLDDTVVVFRLFLRDAALNGWNPDSQASMEQLGEYLSAWWQVNASPQFAQRLRLAGCALSFQVRCADPPRTIVIHRAI